MVTKNSSTRHLLFQIILNLVLRCWRRGDWFPGSWNGWLSSPSPCLWAWVSFSIADRDSSFMGVHTQTVYCVQNAHNPFVLHFSLAQQCKIHWERTWNMSQKSEKKHVWVWRNKKNLWKQMQLNVLEKYFELLFYRFHISEMKPVKYSKWNVFFIYIDNKRKSGE